jgi:hypothetical protein
MTDTATTEPAETAEAVAAVTHEDAVEETVPSPVKIETTAEAEGSKDEDDDDEDEGNSYVDDKGVLVITASRDKKKPHNVLLVGVPYKALPMKALVAVEMGKRLEAADKDMDQVIVALTGWMAAIFGRTQAPQIMARLKDPNDDLDLPDVMEVIKALSKKATKNPTL